MIGMAIMQAPEQWLTVHEIYEWFETHFSYFREYKAGWRNFIRHNLTTNKAFYRVERAGDDPGRGVYWHIAAGLEHQFLDNKNRRQSSIINKQQLSREDNTPSPHALGPWTPALQPNDFHSFSSDGTIDESILLTDYESPSAEMDPDAPSELVNDYAGISDTATIDESTLQPDYQNLPAEVDAPSQWVVPRDLLYYRDEADVIADMEEKRRQLWNNPMFFSNLFQPWIISY